MPISCTYLRTNLTVKDIEKMKEFYVHVFGCVLVREIQQLSGEWIEGIMSVKDGEIKYVHLRYRGLLTKVNATDPEGNIIELQSYAK